MPILTLSDTQLETILINSAADLEKIEQLLKRQASALNAVCSDQGRFSADLLDRQQQHAYDLALNHASLEACKTLHDFAQQKTASTTDRYAAICFIAEAVDEILQRLVRLDKDFRTQANSVRDGGGLGELLSIGLLPDFQAALGEQLVERGMAALTDTLDDEKRMVRETFARFARDEVAPVAEEIHRQDLDIPESLLSKASELGCFGTSIPERFGGLQPDSGGDSLGMIVVTEALSHASLGAAGSLITRPEIAARALLAGGTPEQQEYWLPRLASGKTLCAIAITEPDTGSDVASVSLRAQRVEGGWRLNGAKTWCTFAGRSELLVVLARTGEQSSQADSEQATVASSSGHRGLSLFLVEKPRHAGHNFVFKQEQGELTGKAIATLGYRGMHSYDLFFSDFFVSADNLVGGEQGVGKGFYYTMAGFAGGRIQTAARATGVMQAAFDQALAYCQQRKVFGKRLDEFQLSRIKLARMCTTILACRLFSYRVAQLLDQSHDESKAADKSAIKSADSGRSKSQMAASLVKLFACRAAEWVTREAMQLHGGMGYAEESAVSRYFVDARVLSIFEGAEEVLAIKVVARELIENAAPQQQDKK